MDVEGKIIRKREPNFTADEKALLAQLIKKSPIIEAKLTDGQSISKKKQAWLCLTNEFNSNINVHKRDTATLKRAWDNLKATTRKARASQRGNLLRTGGGPSVPPPTTEKGAIMSMVEEAAPVMICEINNQFDSDGAVLRKINDHDYSASSCIVVLDNELEMEDVPKPSEDEKEEDISTDIPTSKSPQLSPTDNTSYENSSTRKPIDYIRREAIMRIKLLENKKKIELQILKKTEVENMRRETEVIKQEAAKYLLEKNKLEYEKAKLELQKNNK